MPCTVQNGAELRAPVDEYNKSPCKEGSPRLLKDKTHRHGRFPFDQEFRKLRVGERMEQTFSGISFRNFGCTSRGWPKILENSVPFDHYCSGLVSPSLEIEFNMADPQASKHNTSPLSGKRLKYLTATLLQWISLTSFSE